MKQTILVETIGGYEGTVGLGGILLLRTQNTLLAPEGAQPDTTFSLLSVSSPTTCPMRAFRAPFPSRSSTSAMATGLQEASAHCSGYGRRLRPAEREGQTEGGTDPIPKKRLEGDGPNPWSELGRAGTTVRVDSCPVRPPHITE